MYETDNVSYSTNSYRSIDRRPPQYTNKGLIVDKYVRHNQDWIVPRRVMCAFFWTGIILLFTGIILLVTSKHKKGGYQSWGAVLLGLGFCLMLICLILCMHAYCVITVADEEPPVLVSVPPPPPSILTNKHTGSRSPSTPRLKENLSYGSLHAKDTASDTLKSVPEEENCACYSDIQKEVVIYHGSPVIKHKDESEQPVENGLKDTGEKRELFRKMSNSDKKSLDSVGRLPSYSTAIKMPTYSPSRRSPYALDTEVDIEHLKDEVKCSSLDNKRPQLKKSVTFDDSTGDLRMDLSPGSQKDSDHLSVDTHSLSTYKGSDGTLSDMKPRLGTPPYDNEFHLHPATPVTYSPRNRSPIHDIKSSPKMQIHTASCASIPPALCSIPESPVADYNPSIAYTTTTWSHIHPKTHVPLLTTTVPPTCTEVTSAGHHHPLDQPYPSPSSLMFGVVDDSDNNMKADNNEPIMAAKENGQINESFDSEDAAAVVIRKKAADNDSTASSKISVYDNVQYMWKPKSGGELKHFHF